MKKISLEQRLGVGSLLSLSDIATINPSGKLDGESFFICNFLVGAYAVTGEVYMKKTICKFRISLPRYMFLFIYFLSLQKLTTYRGG